MNRVICRIGTGALLLLPAAVIGVAAWLRFSHIGLYEQLVQEDGLIEFAQVGIYFVAALLCFGRSVTVYSAARIESCVVLVVGVALLFVCGEEISWGHGLF